MKMAASRCMCSMYKISKFISQPVILSLSRDFYSNYGRSVVPHCILKLNNHSYMRQFSTCQPFLNSKQPDVKGLADQVLKLKLEQTTSGSQQSPGQDEKEKAERAKADAFAMKTMKYTFYFLGVFFAGGAGYLIVDWGAPKVDDKGNVVEDEYSSYPVWKAYLLRCWREVVFYNKMIKEPSRPKLLPDPLTDPYYQPPYTLVIEMTGVLVHPDWTYKTGWRFKKRPGIDYFLQQVASPLYEVVIYTSEQGFTAYPIIDSLDPNGFIMYKLFRDATRYQKGHHVKDLDCLNRDLSKVILVDWNEKAFELHPNNTFKLRRWNGEDGDRTLVDLASFLRAVATSGVDDVRTVLEHYSQFDDPIEAFRENQKRLQEEEEQKQNDLKDKTSGGYVTGRWSSFFRRN